MKIDVVHFRPTPIKQKGKRALGGIAAWLTGADIKKDTPRFIACNPLKLGANAVYFIWPTSEGVLHVPSWMTFKDVLPPKGVIQTREGDCYEEAILRMASDYWKEFTKIEPAFAAHQTEMFLECPKTFDSFFCKTDEWLVKNFRRDLHILVSWKEWKGRVEKMKLTVICEELAKAGFDVLPDTLRKVRDKYELPAILPLGQ